MVRLMPTALCCCMLCAKKDPFCFRHYPLRHEGVPTRPARGVPCTSVRRVGTGGSPAPSGRSPPLSGSKSPRSAQPPATSQDQQSAALRVVRSGAAPYLSRVVMVGLYSRSGSRDTFDTVLWLLGGRSPEATRRAASSEKTKTALHDGVHTRTGKGGEGQ